jgi:protein-tyrosine phosphatase
MGSINPSIIIITEIPMIDLHTHILPNIDDGANSVEEALALVKDLQKQGVYNIVCTPHFDPTQISLDEFVVKRTSAMHKLKGLEVALLPGSETVLHNYLFHYSDLNALCINDTRYLLTELPFTDKWDSKIYRLLDKLVSYYDIIPIISHIERYPAVKKNAKCINSLIEMGCILQLNTSSILNKKYSTHAFHYLRQGYIAVLGSDCHNIDVRPPIITDAIERITLKIGVSCTDQLMYNAECIIKGMELKEKII